MADVREFNEIDDLEPFADAWSTLLAETSGADFFRSLDWLRVYWKHFGDSQKLRVLTVHEDDKIVGIVPLVVRREWYKLGPFRVLTYPLDDWGSFYGPIGRDPGRILSIAIEYLKSQKRDWDLFELRWVAQCDNFIADKLRENSIPAQRIPQAEVPIVKINQTWDEYWSQRKGSWRSNCRRNERKLKKLGEVRYERFRPEVSEEEVDPRWDLYDACEQIAQTSWQGTSTTGTTITHDSIRPYLRDLHRTAVQTGCADVNVVYVSEQPAAFSYNYFYRGYVSGLRLGFDPQFRSQGAGTVLTHHVLRDSFERGDHTFDFLPGSLEVKRHWNTSVDIGYRYVHYRPAHGRAQLMRLKNWAMGRAEPFSSIST